MAAALAVPLICVSLLPVPVRGQAAPDAEGRVNAKSFGAKGDGRTDDTAAIRSALAATPSGSSLVFPTGVYMISSTISPERRIVLRGDSAMITGGAGSPVALIKKKSGMNGPAIEFSNVQAQGSAMLGLDVDGEPGNRGDGILIAANSIVLRDVGVTHQGGNGIRIGVDAPSVNANSFLLERVRVFLNHGDGLYGNDNTPGGVPGPPDCGAGQIINFTSMWNDGDGLAIKNCVNWMIMGGNIERNKGCGLHMIYAGPGYAAGYHTILGLDLNEANAKGNLCRDRGVRGSWFLGVGANRGSTEPEDNGEAGGGIYLTSTVARFSTLQGTVSSKFNAIGQPSSERGWNPYPGEYEIDGRPVLMSGRGAPGGDCPQGALYLRADGGRNSTLYVCEGGHWAAK
jgi:hypothetical protein